MLVATGQVRAEQLQICATIGELALDGSVRPVKSTISMVMESKARGIARLIVSAANSRDVALVEDVAVYGVGTLGEAVGLLTGELTVEPLSAASSRPCPRRILVDCLPAVCTPGVPGAERAASGGVAPERVGPSRCGAARRPLGMGDNCAEGATHA